LPPSPLLLGTLCQTGQCSLLEFRRGSGAIVCEMPILDFSAVVRIPVSALKTAAAYLGGIDFGAATPATWLRRVPPVSRKLDLDHALRQSVL